MSAAWLKCNGSHSFFSSCRIYGMKIIICVCRKLYIERYSFILCSEQTVENLSEKIKCSLLKIPCTKENRRCKARDGKMTCLDPGLYICIGADFQWRRWLSVEWRRAVQQWRRHWEQTWGKCRWGDGEVEDLVGVRTLSLSFFLVAWTQVYLQGRIFSGGDGYL